MIPGHQQHTMKEITMTERQKEKLVQRIIDRFNIWTDRNGTDDGDIYYFAYKYKLFREATKEEQDEIYKDASFGLFGSNY